MNPVLTKKDFVRRYALGEFGNASPTWNTYQEWADDRGWRYGDLFHIRNRVAGAKTWYDVPWFSLRPSWYRAYEECGAGNLYISAMAPTECTILQGEVQRGLWGLDLHYTTVKKPMRDALATSSHSVRGIIATLILRQYLNQLSYLWLEYLLEEYPNHVVEFSVYSKCWGTVPGFNTVFWEIRNY